MSNSVDDLYQAIVNCDVAEELLETNGIDVAEVTKQREAIHKMQRVLAVAHPCVILSTFVPPAAAIVLEKVFPNVPLVLLLMLALLPLAISFPTVATFLVKRSEALYSDAWREFLFFEENLLRLTSLLKIDLNFSDGFLAEYGELRTLVKDKLVLFSDDISVFECADDDVRQAIDNREDGGHRKIMSNWSKRWKEAFALAKELKLIKPDQTLQGLHDAAAARRGK